MSYQSPHSDINYLYRHISGEYRCCRCQLNEPEAVTMPRQPGGEEEIEVTHYGDNHFDHPEEVLEHLKEHREAGHTVADSTMNRIKEEVEAWE